MDLSFLTNLFDSDSIVVIIINGIIALLLIFKGGKILAGLKEVLQALGATGTAIQITANAIMDNKVDEDEKKLIIDAINKAKGEWKDVAVIIKPPQG